MSARDDLHLIACSDMPVTSDEVEAAIDDFAHELAEQQRAALDDLFERYAWTFHQDAFTELINLIDSTAQLAISSKEPTS